MSDTSPRTILITGATGGIGGALARAYAAPGVQLFLQGRNVEKLAEFASRCASLGASVDTSAIDVRDRAALAAWIKNCERPAPLELAGVVVGLQIKIRPDGQRRRLAEARGAAGC